MSFEKLGLADDAAVTSVSSSCECVQPSIVSYRSTRAQNSYGVLLQFVKESGKGAQQAELESSEFTVSPPVNLAVLIDVKLADGSGKQFTVNLMHTSLVQEVAL